MRPVPLVAPEQGRERLLALLREQREGAEEIRKLLAEPPAAVLEPLGLLTARDLLEAALRTTSAADGGSDETLAASVDLLYQSGLAAIDLLKMHTKMPKVPRGRASRPSA